MPTATALGASFGSVIPGVGTAIGGFAGSVVDFLSSVVPGRTVHFQQVEIEGKANEFATSTAKALQSALSAKQFQELSLRLPGAYKNFLGTSDWWDLTNRQYFLQVLPENLISRPSDYDRVQRTIWLAAIWILVNIDRARPETFSDFMRTWMGGTLAPVLVDLGLSDYDVAIIPVDPLTGTKETKPPEPTPPKSKQAGFSNIWIQIVIVGALVGMAWGIYTSHGK